MTTDRPFRRAYTPALVAFLLAWFCLASTGAADPAADVVLRNGKIYTADAARSMRQAIAFTGNTIVAVGSDEDMKPLIGPETKIVDLDGKLVLPGLIDTHIHPVLGAIARARCSLAGVKATIEALKPAVQACLAKEPGGPDDWLEAVQLDSAGFSATARDLDLLRERLRRLPVDRVAVQHAARDIELVIHRRSRFGQERPDYHFAEPTLYGSEWLSPRRRAAARVAIVAAAAAWGRRSPVGRRYSERRR